MPTVLNMADRNGNNNKNAVIELNTPISGKQKSDKASSSSSWAATILKKDHRSVTTDSTTKKQKIYNFLERPEGFKCLIYHFLVQVYKMDYFDSEIHYRPS